MSVIEKALETDGSAYSSENVLYRERGVTALDVQRSADTLLRLGQKPSIAALREHLGGGSPNTIAPLLEKYWRSLGHRIQAGPDALERVPESLARLTEALWLRAVSDARERVDSGTPSGKTPHFEAFDALERKVTELTAALAESRARESQTEGQLVSSLRDRVQLREQLGQLTTLLKAEQSLRAQDRNKAAAQDRELQERREEIQDLAIRRLAPRDLKKVDRKPAKVGKAVSTRKKLKKKARLASIGKRRKRGRTRLVRQGHR